jgi:hypothetical protein
MEGCSYPVSSCNPFVVGFSQQVFEKLDSIVLFLFPLSALRYHPEKHDTNKASRAKFQKFLRYVHRNNSPTREFYKRFGNPKWTSLRYSLADWQEPRSRSQDRRQAHQDRTDLDLPTTGHQSGLSDQW